MGLVSSTPLANIDFILQEIQLVHYFDVIISSEDVLAGKPSPECYLKAACRLRVAPEECIVFEDAIPGVQAAMNAGMQCVALTTTQPAEKLTHAAYIIHSWNQIYNLPLFAQT